MKRIFAIVAALSLALTASADEGMWLLPLLQKMNGKALKEAGCKLTPEEIYSINHTSLKDAIIHFGGGCTGEIISGEGLSSLLFMMTRMLSTWSLILIPGPKIL